MLTQIINGKILTPNGWVEGGSVIISDSKIMEIANSDLPRIGARIVDVKGDYILPGFVAMNIHGAAGYAFKDSNREQFEMAVKAHLKHGATTIFPTIYTAKTEKIYRAAAICDEILKDGDTPVKGLHIAGPYFNANMVNDFPGAKNPDKEEYVCAAGVSPSGSVHIGNFRDVATSYFVVRALRKMGKKARLLFSWDEYDRCRKIPVNVQAVVGDAYDKYIGTPYVDIPDPWGCHENYAQHFEEEFLKSMEGFGIELDCRYQADMYRSGKYRDDILEAAKTAEETGVAMISGCIVKNLLMPGVDVMYGDAYDALEILSRAGVNVIFFHEKPSKKALVGIILCFVATLFFL